MNKNIGKTDKIIRIVLGVAMIAYGIIEQSLWGAIGIVPIVTALISWCPFYCPLNIKTTCAKDDCKS